MCISILKLSFQATFLSIVHTVTGPLRVRYHPVPTASSASAGGWNSEHVGQTGPTSAPSLNDARLRITTVVINRVWEGGALTFREKRGVAIF